MTLVWFAYWDVLAERQKYKYSFDIHEGKKWYISVSFARETCLFLFDFFTTIFTYLQIQEPLEVESQSSGIYEEDNG